MPTDLLASLLTERADAPAARPRGSQRLPGKIWAIMAVTTLLTFGTLTAGYKMLFAHQLFA